MKIAHTAMMLWQRGNYLVSDKGEMFLFSPPDCGGQGDHGHSFFRIKVENRIENITSMMKAKEQEYSYHSINAHI